MKKETTDFGGPVDATLAAAVAAAKSKRVPVGGVPMPAMPRFDQPPPGNPQAGIRAAHTILSPEEQKHLAEQGRFIPGAGSAYAANQPRVQITDPDGNAQPVNPALAPRAPGAGLRAETVQGLEAIAAANADDDKALKEINKEIEEIDDVWETNEFGARVRSQLANRARQKIIEARCAPMALEDLLMTGRVRQKVPIIPVTFEPTFQSVTGDENLEVLRLMSTVPVGTDSYLMDMLSLYKLTCGLYLLNSKPLPNHLNPDGEFDESLFKAKFKIIRRMALPVLADLVVNFDWFSRRVQKLTVVDDIKGF